MLTIEIEKLDYICLMLKTRYISRLLLALAIMFTFVFHSLHTLEHVLSINKYEEIHNTHVHFTYHPDKSKFELIEDHGYLDDCFVCDNMLSPMILSSAIKLVNADILEILKKQSLECDKFVPLSHIYFNLRGPPIIS